jgi:hypothetical protein
MILSKRIMRSAGAVIVFAASISMVSDESAYAVGNEVAQPVVNCSSGEICVWDQPNYQGRRQVETPGGNLPQCYTPPFVAKSIDNRTSRIVQLYEGEDCKGRLMGTARVNGKNGGVGYLPNVTFRSFKVE